MDERLRFVARLLDGEKMAALCRDSDVPTPAISTVHAVLDRHGLVKRNRPLKSGTSAAPCLFICAQQRSTKSRKSRARIICLADLTSPRRWVCHRVVERACRFEIARQKLQDTCCASFGLCVRKLRIYANCV